MTSSQPPIPVHSHVIATKAVQPFVLLTAVNSTQGQTFQALRQTHFQALITCMLTALLSIA